MDNYRSKKSILLFIDMLAIALSFTIAVGIRFNILLRVLGSVLAVSTYAVFFGVALFGYIVVFAIRKELRIDKHSNRELLFITIEEQIVFIALYVVLFFIFHKTNIISRVVVGLFFIGNVVLVSLGRIFYHSYCIRRKISAKSQEFMNAPKNQSGESDDNTDEKSVKQHVYIVGSKSIGQYGGYESFVMNLLQQHKDEKRIQYHVACKANGSGYMDLDNLPDAVCINDNEFMYCNAHCFMVNIPEKIGAAQAVYYDIRALQWCCEHIEKNHIDHPIVYILASRVGPFEGRYVRRIHNAGGEVWQNPDGHEDWRRKWNAVIRRYWKFSERYAVKNADLVVCDSKSIENYIKDEYALYHPNTTFIAYGAHITPSKLLDDDPKYVNWLSNHELIDGQYYISVGRFVPENNFDIMIREFMSSHTKKDFAIITTENSKYAEELQQKFQYKTDKRIKFVGTVYDQELLGKIRENAYGYFHGHEVGGTNPSLLESLGSTNLNLLYDVGFNKEVAEETALYWSKENGDLAKLIDRADLLKKEDIIRMGEKAKKRIADEYNWELIADKYEAIYFK